MRFLLPLTVFILGLTGLGAASVVATPPNVVLVMTDQQTADALSFRMGRDYLHTPALEGLAARLLANDCERQAFPRITKPRRSTTPVGAGGGPNSDA